MKTFKQFQEDNKYGAATPKMYDSKTTIAPFNLIRTDDVIKKSNKDFKKSTGFNLPIPLAKRGKINSDVLKSNPQLNPDKPGDYIKLKRLSAKIKKA